MRLVLLLLAVIRPLQGKVCWIVSSPLLAVNRHFIALRVCVCVCVRAPFSRRQTNKTNASCEFLLMKTRREITPLWLKNCYRRYEEEYRKPTHRKTVSSASAVSIVTSYALDGTPIESRLPRDFPGPSRPALGPAQPHVKWVSSLFPRLKRLGRGIDQPPTSSVEVKERSELYTFIVVHFPCNCLTLTSAFPTICTIFAYKTPTWFGYET